ncbi:MAG: hypothetical protein ACJ746_01580 [Bryobacteraceae bacterium]
MKPKVNPFVRLLPSLTDVAFVLPILMIFSRLDGVKTLLGDGDTGWHIRTGQWILAHGTIPHKDLFSFTKPDAPWFAWEWLWDVMFGWLHLHFGMAAVVIASLLLISFISALLFRVVIRNCQNRLIAIGITFLAMAGSSIHWLARPHLFTMFFVVIWLAVFDCVERGRTRLLWLLPLLTIAWTNLHGGFVVGILFTGVYSAAKFLEGIFAILPRQRSHAFRSGRYYLLAASACALASLINPYTYHLHQHIVEYLNDTTQLSSISEFQTLSFHAPAAIYFEIVLVLSVIAALDQVRQRRFAPALLLVVMAHLALLAGRNIPLFLLIAAPSVASMLDELSERAGEERASLPTFIKKALNDLREVGEELTSVDRPWRIHLPSVLLAVLVCSIVSEHAHVFKLRAEYDPGRYPASALSMLAPGAGDHRIFCDDEWGDYLAYRLYPEGRVFVDGRSDFYGGQFVRDYLDILGVKYDWETQLAHYGVDRVLLSTTSAMAGAVKQSPRWKVMYDDGIAVLFESTRSSNGIFTNSGNKADAETFPSGMARVRRVSF